MRAVLCIILYILNDIYNTPLHFGCVGCIVYCSVYFLLYILQRYFSSPDEVCGLHCEHSIGTWYGPLGRYHGRKYESFIDNFATFFSKVFV